MKHISLVSRIPAAAQDQSLAQKLAVAAGIVDNIATILTTFATILVAKEAAGTGGAR